MKNRLPFLCCFYGNEEGEAVKTVRFYPGENWIVFIHVVYLIGNRNLLSVRNLVYVKNYMQIQQKIKTKEKDVDKFI